MKIVIVGGGISGWLSALLFPLRQPYHEYVIVESPEVKTIGVGEGTTGLFMTQVINDYFGTPIEEFLRETKATPKIGIEFNNLLPNSDIVWIDKCGHAPMMEHPEKFNEILLDWLKAKFKK